MAYYETHTATTIKQFLIDLGVFASSVGWIVDSSASYQTTQWRLHMHKGNLHADMYSYSTLSGHCYWCTGWTPGSTPDAQPGATGGSALAVVAGQATWFVSTVGGLYFGYRASASYLYWGCFYQLQSKIGTFADGFGAQTPSPTMLFAESINTYGQIYINGSWGGLNATAKSVAGSGGADDLASKGPNIYNAGLIPFPVLVGMRATDTTKIIPLGFAPGLYRVNSGNIYTEGDEIVIGGDTYLLVSRSGVLGSSSFGDYLFKLGA